MKKSKIKLVISEIARKNGVGEEEVRADIQAAIDHAMLKITLSDDPKAKENWDKLLKNGKKPSPEEFIKIISEKLINGGDKL